MSLGLVKTHIFKNIIYNEIFLNNFSKVYVDEECLKDLKGGGRCRGFESPTETLTIKYLSLVSFENANNWMHLLVIGTSFHDSRVEAA